MNHPCICHLPEIMHSLQHAKHSSTFKLMGLAPIVEGVERTLGSFPIPAYPHTSSHPSCIMLHLSNPACFHLLQFTTELLLTRTSYSTLSLSVFSSSPPIFLISILFFDLVQALSNLAWGLGSLGFRHPAFMCDLVRESTERLDCLSPQNLHNVAWACATLDLRDPLLMSVWPDHILGRLTAFEAQGLSNIAWAFAKLGRGVGGRLGDDGFYTALAGEI